MPTIYHNSGGYRKLHSFSFASIVHLGTIDFCKRFIHWKQDPLGKTVGQMVGASRSGKQNIIEGSERAKTSAETEIKLTDVAKASFGELQGDFEDFLLSHGQIPWSIKEPRHQAIMAVMLDQFVYTDDVLHDYWTFLLGQKAKFDPWLNDDDPVTVANAMILLLWRTTGLLTRQLAELERAFLERGGIREQMTSARQEARAVPEGPLCPQCEAPMRKRNSSRGPFWGCGTYPACKGTRAVE